ncbi:MAG TPA: DNRLRE domain-containing protein, partial [Myxococcaceae bacterium]|nr:DNRLRE domain-containing protein [Myxococcaceae bacterium]
MGLIAACLGAVAGCGDSTAASEATLPGEPVRQVAGLGTRTLTFTVAADTWADASAPAVNRGTQSVFKSDGAPSGEAFLRFDVSGLNGATVRRATLRLYAVNPTSDGPEVYATSSGWSETGLTWSNRPARAGVPSADSGAIAQEAWVALDVTPLVRADGAVSFVLLHTYSDGAEFLAREAGRNPAQLVLDVEDPSTGNTVRFVPEADASVLEAQPSTNFGSAGSLEVDGSPQSETHLRFRLSGLSGQVVSAKLRLLTTNPTSQGPALYATTGSWDERAVTWATRPARQGAAVATLGAVADNEWVELDVTPLVSGNGVLSVVLAARSSDGVDFRSREALLQTPELVVTLAGQQPPPPSGETRTFGAVADAYTDDAWEWKNFNTGELRVDSSPSRLASFLRFDMSGLRGDVTSAKLRLFVLNGTSDGPSVWTTWVGWWEKSIAYVDE